MTRQKSRNNHNNRWQMWPIEETSIIYPGRFVGVEGTCGQHGSDPSFIQNLLKVQETYAANTKG